jgi:DNA repair exonuclease SbcCD ATPase subunit
LEGELRTTRLQETHDRQLLDAALGALPQEWRPLAQRGKLADQLMLKSELDELTRSGAETRAAELQQAKAERETLKTRREQLASQEADFPPEARVLPAVAALQVAEARQALAEREDGLQQARSELSVLEARSRQRESLGRELLTLEGHLNEAKVLAELLDRKHLQRHLVRQAERQIVGFANAVLDRLSGGQLCLRLRGGDGDDESDAALELEAFNRQTGRDAINVAFLSGSQRFRVAVALALGIGQYASRQHRPIESVIIDEGFGCLDRFGRQVMIQELKNLQGHLRCVLLVSHQEEFAEAFAHGYHFELVNGATQVTQVMR